MRIIDFHAHIYPEKIAEKAVENVGKFYTMKMLGDGTADTLIQNGKNVGVERFVVHSPALSPTQVLSINDSITAACAAHPELIGFGTLHAGMEHPREEIARVQSLGLRGIKIHPDSQQFDLDCDEMMEIYSILEKEELPVLFHTGDYRYDYSHPRRLLHVMQEFPGLTCIAAHFGGWSVFDLAVEYLLDTNCYLDISSSMSFLGPRRSRELIELYTPKRMLFGSDFPMWTPESELEKFNALGFDEKARELILYRNAEAILKI